MSSAYLLVTHGSRDLRPQVAANCLAQLVSKRLETLENSRSLLRGNTVKHGDDAPLATTSPSLQQAIASSAPLVGTAVLELHPLPLHQQIQQFAEQAIASGCNRLVIVPLFLLPGVHVMEDIPAQVAIAQTHLAERILLETSPHLGSHPRISQLLTVSSESSSTAETILLSHGSRRAGGNTPVEAIAASLNARPAYWSVPPSLESQISSLVRVGCQSIVILPYFLFEGAITDAIAQSVQQLSHQFPYVQLHLAEPLGASEPLASLILELIGATVVVRQ